MTGSPEKSGSELTNRLALAFKPLDKRAFGVALGVATGLVVAVATTVTLIRGPTGLNIGLLGQYLYGYTVSWPGVPIGFVWSFVVGFVAGWFVAFCRNFVLAVSVFLVRTRAELFQTREFLDHI